MSEGGLWVDSTGKGVATFKLVFCCCWLLVVGCWFCLSVVSVCVSFLLFLIGWRLLSACCWLSGVAVGGCCWLLVVGCHCWVFVSTVDHFLLCRCPAPGCTMYNIPHFLVWWFNGFGFDAFFFILVMLVHYFLPCDGLMHGLINYTDTKAKCCYL